MALTIFTVITVAIGMALSTGLRAQSAAQSREDDNGRVRAVFDALGRDIQAAYASPTSPATEFIAGTGNSGGQSGSASSSGLLTMTTLSAIVQADDVGGAGGAQGNPSSGINAVGGTGSPTPQSDSQFVRYALNSGTGVLTRSVTRVPNSQLLDQARTGPANTLAIGIASLQISFWDMTQKSWRTDWDYEPQTQSSAQGGTSTSTSQPGGETSGNTGSSSGDTVLPSAVKISLELIKAGGGTEIVTTTIPVIAPQPPTATDSTAASAATSPTSGGGTPGPASGTGTTP